ncbi:MAG: hypothetical protein WCL49_11200 [bacterium]
MSLVYSINDSGSHLTVTGTGKVTAECCINLLKDILKDPRCQPDQTALIDMREATVGGIETSGILAIAKLMEECSQIFKNHIAIVARSSDLLSAELLSTHVRNAKKISIRVFVDQAAAMDYCRAGWQTH